ncbi:MAG: sugar phosphate isomerase/epimerase [Clostridia bacterium]|nr:sugar phosphate isomerase/epimerase [Clostridia bacterium]
MKVGAQLFSLRDFCKTPEDFAETLKKVADIGYTSVQVSGTCEYEADWLLEKLKENGLTCDLTHYSFDKMTADPAGVVDFHKKFGCKYIGVGCLPNWDKGDINANTVSFAERAKPVAEKFKELGALMMYHNHHFEYFADIDGKNIMEYLSDNFASDELGFTLDTHWVMSGNHDPIEEIKRLSGRLPCVHFKDLVFSLDFETKNFEKRFAPVGYGIIKFEPIVAELENAGTEFIFVEQDVCYGEDPFACMKKSYDYLVSIGLR